MLSKVTVDSIRARIVEFETERQAVAARAAYARQNAIDLAFDAETDRNAKAAREGHLSALMQAERRLAEVDAALASGRKRLDQLAEAEQVARKVEAARQAARIAEQRAKAARRLDKALQDAERAYTEYTALEPELASQLRAAGKASPEETRTLASRAARAVRFAAWALAPSLIAALGSPRATVAHRRALADANRTLTPALPEYAA